MSNSNLGMFPRGRFWFSRGYDWKPISFHGSDEWGTHTICLTLPLVGSVVIRTKACDCDDMAEFTCTFPLCPMKSIVAGDPCMTHDEDFWREVRDEETPTT